MAILVDAARWPWRGTTWCHLVTDSHLEELHEFARTLGCRRIGFQGDHYDIDIDTRRLAVEAGAVECSSREVVRSLRAAGLRLRPSQFEKWSLIGRWEGPAGERIDERVERLTGAGDRLGSVAEIISVADSDAAGGFLVGRSANTALVIHGQGRPPAVDEDEAAGVYSRIDHRGLWAIEVAARPLAPRE